MKSITGKALRCTALILGAWLACSAAAETPRSYRFDIEEQTLSQALRKFSQISRQEILFTEDLVRSAGKVSLKGEFTAEAALQHLLKGTGLTVRRSESGAITIVKQSDQLTHEVPSDQMRLAAAAEPQRPEDSIQPEDARQVVVQDTKLRSALAPNLDLPRTIDDPQPYYVYDNETIERSGAVTVEDFIKQRMTMNTVVMTNGQGQQRGNVLNETQVNLRGLGNDHTLVLVNGRRSGEQAYQSWGQRLNEIPVSMIERIEVLPTSASGIYGGNAVGGVINIILKRDFTGGALSVNFDRSENAGDRARTISASHGWALEGGRTRIALSLNWRDAEPMVLGDRADLYYKSIARIEANHAPFLETGFNGVPLGRSTNVMPASTSASTLTLLDGTPIGSRIAHVPDSVDDSTSGADLRAALLAGGGSWSTELPETSQTTGLRRPLEAATSNRSAGFSVQRRMLPWLDMVLELRHNESESDSIATLNMNELIIQGQPVPEYPSICAILPFLPECMGPPQMGPPASPVNPYTETVRVSFPVPYDTRWSGSGSTSTGALTADLRLPLGWRGMLDFAHTRSEWNANIENFDLRMLSDEIYAGTFNPFVGAAQLWAHDWSRYAYPDVQRVRSRTNDFSARLYGPLAKLPWGDTSLAVALERRISTRPGHVRELALAPSFGTQTPTTHVFYEQQSIASSAYAETLVPLLRQGARRFLHALELQLAARIDRLTQDSGTSGEIREGNGTLREYIGTTRDGEPYSEAISYESNHYTVGLRYQPIPQLTLRASRATAFLPPTLDQLTPPDPGALPMPQSVDDPQGLTPGLVPVIVGGNPDLTPQNSTSFNAGVILQPGGWLTGLRLNVEYYEIDQQDVISALGAQTLVDNEAAFPDRIVRDPVTGAITRIDDTTLNLYRRSTRGLDCRLDYSRMTDFGYLGITAAHTSIEGLSTQYALGQPMFDAAGYPSEGGAARHKSNFMLTWERGQWMFSWSTVRYGSYGVYGAPGGPNSMRFADGGVFGADRGVLPQGAETVPAQTFHDLTIGFRTAGEPAAAGLAQLFQGLSMQFGVRNLFATEPELDVSYRGNFFRSPYGGNRLRSFWFSARKSF